MDLCKTSPLGTLGVSDWTKGLITAVIGAGIGTAYTLLSNGFPANSAGWKAVGVAAGGSALLAGLAYLGKNLGTGANGQLLTNASATPPVAPATPVVATPDNPAPGTNPAKP
jgi:hypothetical protein